jgi:hypothetical protein
MSEDKSPCSHEQSWEPTANILDDLGEPMGQQVACTKDGCGWTGRISMSTALRVWEERRHAARTGYKLT